jgi:hypothetical protein
MEFVCFISFYFYRKTLFNKSSFPSSQFCRYGYFVIVGIFLIFRYPFLCLFQFGVLKYPDLTRKQVTKEFRQSIYQLVVGNYGDLVTIR